MWEKLYRKYIVDEEAEDYQDAVIDNKNYLIPRVKYRYGPTTVFIADVDIYSEDPITYLRMISFYTLYLFGRPIDADDKPLAKLLLKILAGEKISGNMYHSQLKKDLQIYKFPNSGFGEEVNFSDSYYPIKEMTEAGTSLRSVKQKITNKEFFFVEEEEKLVDIMPHAEVIGTTKESKLPSIIEVVNSIGEELTEVSERDIVLDNLIFDFDNYDIVIKPLDLEGKRYRAVIERSESGFFHANFGWVKEASADFPVMKEGRLLVSEEQEAIGVNKIDFNLIEKNNLLQIWATYHAIDLL